MYRASGSPRVTNPVFTPRRKTSLSFQIAVAFVIHVHLRENVLLQVAAQYVGKSEQIDRGIGQLLTQVRSCIFETRALISGVFQTQTDLFKLVGELADFSQ